MRGSVVPYPMRGVAGPLAGGCIGDIGGPTVGIGGCIGGGGLICAGGSGDCICGCIFGGNASPGRRCSIARLKSSR